MVTNEELGKRFASALRAARAPGSQNDAAIKSGLLQRDIAKVETGFPPSLRQFVRLAAAYPVLFEALLDAVKDVQNRPAS